MNAPETYSPEQDAVFLAQLLRRTEYAALSQVESNALTEWLREFHKWDAARISAAFVQYRVHPLVVRNIMGLGGAA